MSYVWIYYSHSLLLSKMSWLWRLPEMIWINIWLTFLFWRYRVSSVSIVNRYQALLTDGIKKAECHHTPSVSVNTFRTSCYTGVIAYSICHTLYRSFNFPHPEGITFNSNLSYQTCQDWESCCISQLQFRHGIELPSLKTAGILLPLK